MDLQQGLPLKAIITVAVTGSRPTQSMNPAVPYSPQAIAQSAIESWRAGAAIAHIHVRDPITGAPAFQADLFREVLQRIRADTDMLVNLTTSGLHLPQGDVERLMPVDLGPDLCSLDVGSLNFEDRVFSNPPDWVESAAQHMLSAGVKPELEVFEVGHIAQALDLIARDLVAPPPFFQLCMGVKWGMPATPENLNFMCSKLPQGAVWSVLGVGATQPAMIGLGLALGGHVRVGFEDNLYLSKGVLAESNAQFVEQAVRAAHENGRSIAAPEEARAILKLSQLSGNADAGRTN